MVTPCIGYLSTIKEWKEETHDFVDYIHFEKAVSSTCKDTFFLFYTALYWLILIIIYCLYNIFISNSFVLVVF